MIGPVDNNLWNRVWGIHEERAVTIVWTMGVKPEYRIYFMPTDDYNSRLIKGMELHITQDGVFLDWADK